MKVETEIYLPKTDVMAKFIKGILIGAVAGAVIGILYAPRKGSKTRKMLRRKGAGIKDAIRSEFNAIEEKVDSQYESIKEDTAELLEQGKERLQDEK